MSVSPTGDELELLVLGSAAGGGFPQWNCGCDQCQGVRRGDARFEARSEDTLALLARGGCFLVNASPSAVTQLARYPSLWPHAPRASPIRGVVLTNGDLDHTLGLFALREWHPLAVYATERVRQGLEQNAMLRTLQRFPGQLVWRRLELECETELVASDGAPTGIRVTPIAAEGKPPLHLLGDLPPHAEDNVSLSVRAPSGARALYASSTGSLTKLCAHFAGAELLLLDGTFWSEEEPLGFGAPAGARAMGHLPMGGPGGSVSLPCPIPKRFFTHINNTNPVLDANSEARAALSRAGWELARDGMSFRL